MRLAALVGPDHRRLSLAALAALAFAGSACRDGSSSAPVADPAAPVLTGRWEKAPLALQPAGRMEFALTFSVPNRFRQDVRTFGLLPGQAANDLSGYSRIEGTYSTDGATIDFMPRRVVSWDRFHGANSPEQHEDPARYADLFHHATFAVEGNRLTLDFVSYPADAPVASQSIFTRAP